MEPLPGLLLDHLSVPLRGLAVTAQSLAVGGVAFLLLLAVPLAPRLGPALGPAVLRRAGRITAWAGLVVALVSLARIALQLAALVVEVGIPLGRALGAGFVGAWGAQAAAGVAIAALLRRGRRPSGAGAVAGLATAALATVGGSVATSHAAGRLEPGLLLGVATALHELGAAVWIGGLPCLLAALALAGDDGASLRAVGRRYSLMSMAGVAAVAGGGIVLAVAYVGSWPALYATAYGLTAGVKVALFLALLGLGAANYRVVERLRRDPATPALRLRRFAEVELGVGVAAFLAAASLASAPPGVDVREEDRVTPAEIAGRVWPPAPRLRSPARDAAIPSPPPGDAFDAARSELGHDRAGLLLLAVGGLALAERSGLTWGRRWPLLLPVFAVLLALEADLAAGPPRDVGPSEDSGGTGDAQHHAGARHLATVLAALALTVLGLCEWGVRAGWVRDPRAAQAFPLACVGVALLLLSHGHAAPDPEGALLVAISHDLVALLGLGAGSSRWIELRMAGSPAGRAAGWAWPACLLAVGLVLLGYREAPSPGGRLQPEGWSSGIGPGARSRDEVARPDLERGGVTGPSVADGQEKRLRGGGVMILDVRLEDEFAPGHLPGALNTPLAELERRLADLPATRSWLIAAAPTASSPSRRSPRCGRAASGSAGSRTAIPSGRRPGSPSRVPDRPPDGRGDPTQSVENQATTRGRTVGATGRQSGGSIHSASQPEAGERLEFGRWHCAVLTQETAVP